MNCAESASSFFFWWKAVTFVYSVFLSSDFDIYYTISGVSTQWVFHWYPIHTVCMCIMQLLVVYSTGYWINSTCTQTTHLLLLTELTEPCKR